MVHSIVHYATYVALCVLLMVHVSLYTAALYIDLGTVRGCTFPFVHSLMYNHLAPIAQCLLYIHKSMHIVHWGLHCTAPLYNQSMVQMYNDPMSKPI